MIQKKNNEKDDVWYGDEETIEYEIEKEKNINERGFEE